MKRLKKKLDLFFCFYYLQLPWHSYSCYLFTFPFPTETNQQALPKHKHTYTHTHTWRCFRWTFSIINNCYIELKYLTQNYFLFCITIRKYPNLQLHENEVSLELFQEDSFSIIVRDEIFLNYNYYDSRMKWALKVKWKYDKFFSLTTSYHTILYYTVPYKNKVVWLNIAVSVLPFIDNMHLINTKPFCNWVADLDYLARL